ncbi:MAG TPA: Stp1/IreP family PP2C-type Ser/Thr phosphatase [Vicinamibacterales bacterium]|nr:Stp1/IreP family PP2C-type Ser/Thr phosphatase [Vicinamibacterales bacterium]
MRLKVGAATSVGRVRPINEDAYLVRAEQGLFVVCDGMGGAAAGEVASALAVETIAAETANGGLIGAPQRGFQPRTAGLGKAIEAANRAIIERSKNDEEHAGMGTTVVGVWVEDGIASIAHVGDSRAYLRNESGFEALTSDHSLVEAQVQAGLIDREQSLKSEHQNILLRALGRDPEIDVELSETTVAIGDRMLLCTDGLTRTVSDDGLAEALDRFRGDPQGACDHLIEMANTNGGPDNVTVLVVEFQGSRLSKVFQTVLGS